MTDEEISKFLLDIAKDLSLQRTPASNQLSMCGAIGKCHPMGGMGECHSVHIWQINNYKYIVGEIYRYILGDVYRYLVGPRRVLEGFLPIRDY